MIIRDEKGLALPLVIMVMFVITLLGAAVLQYGVTDAMQVARDEKRMQAHYLARSGADAMAAHLIRNPAAIPDIVTRTAINMATGSLGPGRNFRLRVSGNATTGVAILAEGNSAGVTARVNLDLVPLSTSAIFDHAIATRGDLDVASMKHVSGSLLSAGNITAPQNYAYPLHPNAPFPYPPPIIPSLPSAPDTTINVRNNDNLTLRGDFWYSSIDVNNNGILTFNTEGRRMRVVVHTLETKGDIRVNNSQGGRLELFITGSADIQTPLVVNNGDPNSLIIFLADGVNFEMQANGQTNAFIYGPNARVYLQSAWTQIRGAIIANIFWRHHNQDDSISRVVYHRPSETFAPLTGVVMLQRLRWRD